MIIVCRKPYDIALEYPLSPLTSTSSGIVAVACFAPLQPVSLYYQASGLVWPIPTTAIIITVAIHIYRVWALSWTYFVQYLTLSSLMEPCDLDDTLLTSALKNKFWDAAFKQKLKIQHHFIGKGKGLTHIKVKEEAEIGTDAYRSNSRGGNGSKVIVIHIL